MVKAQLAAGARAVLGLVHVRRPDLSLEDVASGPPRGRRIDMRPHYKAADGPSATIANLREEETY